MSQDPIQFSPEHLGDMIIEKTKSDPKRKFFKYTLFIGVILCVVLLLTKLFITELNQPPSDFPINEPVVIESGTGIRAITEILESAHVVRSDALLYYALVLFFDPANVKASTYVFTEPLSTFEVAERLSEGDFDTDLTRFTHYEGERVTKLADRAAEVLPSFNKERFLLNATPQEGKLFPETYFIPNTYTDEDLLTLLLETFESNMTFLQEQIDQSSLSLEEILVLASIIEREANTIESKKNVSGILQNRLEIGMALQADASIEYVLDKPLSELTPEDLEIDSPYNTYLYPGLPPTPIGNPGLDAIMAVLEPTQSDNFYYITDADGVFHYAKTYTEHQRNIERYLR